MENEMVSGPGWLETLKKEAGPWKDRNLVVLSLFDGLGATWQALHNLGIPTIGYSSEVDPDAIQVVKQRWPNVIHLGDVQKIKPQDVVEQVVDLVVGGFPCQDLSAMNKYRLGLHGPRSGLFFHLLRILQEFKPTWFVVENVQSMTWIDRDEVTKYLGVPPVEIDSAELTPQARRRYFWTNIPIPKEMPSLRMHRTTQLQHVLEDATALESKCGTIMLKNFGIQRKARVQPVWCRETNHFRSLNAREVERIFGLPDDYTNIQLSYEESPPLSTSDTDNLATRTPITRLSRIGNWSNSKELEEDDKGKDVYKASNGSRQNESDSCLTTETLFIRKDVIDEEEDVDIDGEPSGEDSELNGVSPYDEKCEKESNTSGHSVEDEEWEEWRHKKPKRKRGKPGGTRRLVGSNRARLGEINWKSRWKLLGNSFSVPVMAYICSPLLKAEVRLAASPLKLPEVVPPNVTSQKCAFLQPDELWALYSDAGRPNWYAFIRSRAGGRFAESSKGRSTPCLKIVLDYLEFTEQYAMLELDWNPKDGSSGRATERGTGSFQTRNTPEEITRDTQTDPLKMFSHRVTSFLSLENGNYFIYPGKDSVWAVRDKSMKNTFAHVYVVESSIRREGLDFVKVGNEGFKARVRVLVKTSRIEYRFSDREQDATDLSVFAFEVPYFYKNNCCTFILEPHNLIDNKADLGGE